MHRYFSLTLVLIQFGCIGMLAWFSEGALSRGAPLFYIVFGMILGVWAIIVMRKSKLHITPEVDRHAELVMDGPYRLIRHPMYTSVLLVCLGLLLASTSQNALFVYLLLVFNLVIKLYYEESMLKKKFRQYREYMKKTKRLLPYIY